MAGTRGVSSKSKQTATVNVCGTCKLGVGKDDKAMLCSLCDLWHHTTCEKLDVEVYKFLVENNVETLHWYCNKCNGMLGRISSVLSKLASGYDGILEDLNSLKNDFREKCDNFFQLVDKAKEEVLDRIDLALGMNSDEGEAVSPDASFIDVVKRKRRRKEKKIFSSLNLLGMVLI